MNRKIYLLELIFLTMFNCMFAQTPDFIELLTPAEFNTEPEEMNNIVLEINVEKGYHIQANPVEEDFLIPTTVKITSSKNVLVGNPVYPAGKTLTLRGTEENLVVYDGKIYIIIPVQITQPAQKDFHLIEGELEYQACDSVKCFMPRTITFAIPVKSKNS